jgi:hypothetical protein
MRRPDDYSGEMNRSSSDEIHVAERLRGALVKAPAPEVEAAHLVSMAAAVEVVAAAAELKERGNDMRSFTKKRALVLAAAATLALGAGLAAAVTLPDQASDRAEEVQAAKPAKTNGQDGPSVASSAHGQAVSDLARDDSTRGCEQGRAVSDLASSKAADNRNNDGPDHDPCEKDGNGGANRATGKAWGHGDPPGRRIGQAKQAEAKVKPAQAGGVGHGRGGSKSDAAATDTAGTTGTTGTTGGGTTEPSPEPTQDSTSTPTPESSPTA